MLNPIKNTDKWGCRQLAAALAAFGVRHVVTSPGSRNAPLLMAVERHKQLEAYSVIDERSAGFIALGMACVSGEPVALICTSGTALLNYAPAVAEAFYRQVPLIVVSADRPRQWIDQADSQTLRQPGALSNIVRGTFDFAAEAMSDEEQWYVNRMLNDAMHCATGPQQGPVHINIALSQPLTAECDDTAADMFRKIECMRVPDVIPVETARNFATSLCCRKVLVVAGINAPSAGINRALASLASMPNVAVLAEGLANVHARGCHLTPDMLIRHIDEPAFPPAGFVPDVLITFGGALVSARLKRWLRSVKPKEHWHIGHSDAVVDCFMSLTRRIEIAPEGWLPRVASAMAHLTRIGANSGTYAETWACAAAECNTSISLPWSGSLAVREIIASLPPQWNLQLSNGLTVRQALDCDLSKVHRTDCNRGVSGIDGSVSTAVGASALYPHPTLLITGDMSMQYDLAALSSTLVSNKLRIVVMSNGGGGIFHYVKGTASLPEMPRLLNGELKLPLEQLATAYGLDYVRAVDKLTLKMAIGRIKADTERPLLVEIVTDADEDAKLL